MLPFRTSYSFWFVRAALLRGVGLIYAVAFLILVRQGSALIGHAGLLPATRYLARLTAVYHSRSAGFWQLPSVFWLSSSDAWLQGCATNSRRAKATTFGGVYALDNTFPR